MADFTTAVRRLADFDRLGFEVGQLLDDPNWPWGYDHGVYCFIVDGAVVYVGRALGCTLGERVYDHLHSTDDPAWEEVVTRRDNRVEIFAVPEARAFLSASLEAYLIEQLAPRFNSRLG
ncbi:hypothetical protein FDZ71_00040 [bacterium]|nr:MAG: hypothetical protein FDZ71_00040 [bacterium]